MTWIGNSASSGLTCPVPRALGSQVAELLHRMQPVVANERRTADRQPIPFLFEFSPRPEEASDFVAEKFVVVGKDVGGRGIGFYHQKPIPFRRGVLSIELPDESVVRLEVDLSWCRFTQFGWYESGGQLLGITSSTFPTSQAG